MAFSGLLLAGFLLVPFQFVSNFSSADRSGETRERAQWTRILAQPIPQNAILISNDRDEMMPLWYIQYVENTRRDVVGLFPLITPGPQTADIANLTDLALESQRPVFFIKPMPGIETRYVVEKSDILWRVVCNCPPRPQYASDAKLAGALRLIGYDLSQSAGTLDATLYWQPLTRLDGNYTTFAQLIDSQHNKIAQGIDHQVGGDYYPTSFWRIGETLRDEQTITLPSTLSPGSYSLVAGMYHYPDMEMLGEPISLTVELR